MSERLWQGVAAGHRWRAGYLPESERVVFVRHDAGGGQLASALPVDVVLRAAAALAARVVVSAGGCRCEPEARRLFVACETCGGAP